jgi:hypothetical protein
MPPDVLNTQKERTRPLFWFDIVIAAGISVFCMQMSRYNPIHFDGALLLLSFSVNQNFNIRPFDGVLLQKRFPPFLLDMVLPSI